MKSIIFRNDPLFLRNEYETAGKWQMPLIHKQELDLSNIQLISFANAKYNDTEANKSKGLHFFVDDYRFISAYTNPEKQLEKISQYRFTFTPDYSTYSNMNYWRQLESIAHSRWCGAFWQDQGLTVIPTISWSTPVSFDFCFDAIENGCIVAIGMIGCKRSKKEFMTGYNEMLKRINPEAIICLGEPFSEMKGNIIKVDYQSTMGKEIINGR